MCDLCSMYTENDMENSDLVMVTWSRVQQSGGEKNSDSRWILKIESSALTQAFFNEHYDRNIFFQNLQNYFHILSIAIFKQRDDMT